MAHVLQRAGVPLGPGPTRQLDREAFQKMSLKELEEFSGRFAIVVADALMPAAQARAIEESLIESRFFQGHAIAVRAIAPTMSRDYLFDNARSAAITRAVERGHEQTENWRNPSNRDPAVTAAPLPGSMIALRVMSRSARSRRPTGGAQELERPAETGHPNIGIADEGVASLQIT
jgi:hypothetical protein